MIKNSRFINLTDKLIKILPFPSMYLLWNKHREFNKPLKLRYHETGSLNHMSQWENNGNPNTRFITHSVEEKNIRIPPGKVFGISSELFFFLSEADRDSNKYSPNKGLEIQVRALSGLKKCKNEFIPANNPGTVSMGYRGEVSNVTRNRGNKDVIISPGDELSELRVSEFSRCANFKNITDTEQKPDSNSILIRGPAGYNITTSHRGDAGHSVFLEREQEIPAKSQVEVELPFNIEKKPKNNLIEIRPRSSIAKSDIMITPPLTLINTETQSKIKIQVQNYGTEPFIATTDREFCQLVVVDRLDLKKAENDGVEIFQYDCDKKSKIHSDIFDIKANKDVEIKINDDKEVIIETNISAKIPSPYAIELVHQYKDTDRNKDQVKFIKDNFNINQDIIESKETPPSHHTLKVTLLAKPGNSNNPSDTIKLKKGQVILQGRLRDFKEVEMVYSEKKPEEIPGGRNLGSFGSTDKKQENSSSPSSLLLENSSQSVYSEDLSKKQD